VGTHQFRINTPVITHPNSYDSLPPPLLEESQQSDVAFLFTNVRYDNNYFYSGFQGNILLSFSGWNLLTDLPVTNGLVYFIAQALTEIQQIGRRHEEITGCINDILVDKRGVDMGMRAAFICTDCFDEHAQNDPIAHDIQRLLDLVSSASRIRRNVLENTPPTPQEQKGQLFDIFLCHNSEDKPAIKQIKTFMQNAGIATWFDEEQLVPGFPWQDELERQIPNVRKAAVFVGRNGMGPWQDRELRAFISEFVSRGCPVIPVILPDAGTVPELPIFLRQMTWVDLRTDYEDNLLRLVAAVQRR
jgi:hypothetical protein